MDLQIPYRNLQLVQYEGAGNKTPVLNIGMIPNINNYHPFEVKKHLEKDRKFRIFLKEEGIKCNADTIMVYYSAHNQEHDYVTFIAEPNAPLSSQFSDMCGNGIRALAFHIYQILLQHNVNPSKKLRIWAGSLKTIEIKYVNLDEGVAMVAVDMGIFKSSARDLSHYVAQDRIGSIRDLSSIDLDIRSIPFLINKKVGIGFNGSTLIGEPHLVVLFSQKQFEKIKEQFFCAEEEFMICLRKFASLIGSSLTFNKTLFPHLMNVNVGIVIGNSIYMSTHERNMSTNEDCQKQIASYGICRCNTLACGTGGAVAANIAIKQKYIKSDTISTIHPGGVIQYTIKNNRTIMIGETKKLETKETLQDSRSNIFTSIEI